VHCSTPTKLNANRGENFLLFRIYSVESLFEFMFELSKCPPITIFQDQKRMRQSDIDFVGVFLVELIKMYIPVSVVEM
jgi:hypothetical protein